MPKVVFKIADEEKVAEFIFELKDSLTEGALEERNNNPCIFVPLSANLRKELIESKKLSKELKERIKKESKKFVDSNREDFKQFKKEIEEYWNSEVNDLYFKEIERLTRGKFKDSYCCYITNAVVGAYFGEKDVTVGYNKKYGLKMASIVLAEELLHHLYWDIWEKVMDKKMTEETIYEGKKWCSWHISEVIPEYLLVENLLFEKFGWNKSKRWLGYTWIPELRKILDLIWKSKKNFRDFITKAEEKIKKC